MGSFKTLALAGLLAATSTAALSADLLPPAPSLEAVSPVAHEDVGAGWYLRGDIGMTNQGIDRLSYVPKDEALRRGYGDHEFDPIHHEFDSSPFVGIGVGYQFNPWIRADITGEYRGQASFNGLERSILSPDEAYANQYNGSKSEWVGLANLYFDLGTWYGVTPFIGAGVGFTHTTISGFIDAGPGYSTSGASYGLAFGPERSETDLAWAVHAGLAYDVNPNLKLEIAYRYLNLGDAKTGTLVRYDNSGCRCLAAEFKDIDSHDIKIGMRWMLNPPVAAAVAPAAIAAKY